ncbi:UDP-N-acetylmuramoyl-L-alanyl-D-glutamate--2,6-diaminopimelate ligase [Shewanella surugensis]|uniref:UDP-N-acetylmuramyl-tripeptide synthetase n=1 Tax=Shewanella surugensis TaxID=212020 RepID=A0ABT0L7C3_9GAMM|nr:UDP-N-acetylmuramoyl-L-alanyl-D-glutamate--2,6-diaminopimelate ligase [Shewanella surugensis]MCL1123592.1 UDP-N-acetylmuramoyl-L-alanyl-D-glutamate--2,6-diaminopimelate ligase [Shewanella surugensis]
MLLQDLLAPWFHYSGSENINNMTLDSRHIKTGDLFIAIPGHAVDGRNYIQAAFNLGAIAVLMHTDNPEEHGKVSHEQQLIISFFQLNNQLSALASHAYPLSAERLRLIGITGTNGKTSVSQFIAQLTHLKGCQSAVMGTLGNGLFGELVESSNTTADAVTLMQQLQEYDRQGVDLCAMEVSSHGLVQARVQAVPFDLAIFTNLSRDHLDYHGSMNEYGAAKKRLFQFPSVKTAVINQDDELGRVWLKTLAQDGSNQLNLLGFSANGDEAAAVYAKNVQFNTAGVIATLVWPEGEATIQSPLLGAFNLSNLLAALTALYGLNEDMSVLLTLVPKLTPVAGRMERFIGRDGVTLVVDYAHTPDAVTQALSALRVHCQRTLWCVLGCGGDRDKGKRPLMAQAAEMGADHVMLTSDNARGEDPHSIIDDMLMGLNDPSKVLVEVNREQAIREVVMKASSGDLILLAGKGHETYQEVKGIKYDYDERQLAYALTEGSS